jgi:hypothetical protein
MSEVEILRNEMRNEIEELRNEMRNEMRNEIEELRCMFKAFAEPCAIGSEQLWEVVYNDILKQPVPNGVDLRELV